MSKDNEKEIMSIFGDRSFAHFINMHEKEQSFSLPYSELLKRCEESDGRVKYLVSRCLASRVPLVRAETTEELNSLLEDAAKFKHTTKDLIFDSFENDIKRTEQFVKAQEQRAREMNEDSN